MHGLGNDFMVIDGYSMPVELSIKQIRFLADRHRGVGFDQLLLVEKPKSDNVDFCYRIFNSDGGEVEQCGNGIRCFGRFVVDKGLTQKSKITVETMSGVVNLRLNPDGQVTASMGMPHFAPTDIPFEAPQAADKYELKLSTTTDSRIIELGVVSMGNPHAVIAVDNIDTAPVAQWGPEIEHHARFPQRVNVGFMQVIGRNHIRLRVFERGVGETQACGTGACAAMVIARQWGMVDDKVLVDLLGGCLHIQWSGNTTPVMMTGPAETVFEGTVTL